MLQRQQPSSHFKVKYLSPASALKRRQAAQQERLADKAKITKYESLEVILDHASHDSILKQVESYKLFKETCRSSGKRLLKSDGVLIFDEVKVVSSLIWNSRNHQLIGLAMSETDQASLQDIYQLLEDDRHTKYYILQFLWRDLTSSFDIVGLYFTSEDTVTAKFICMCF